MDIQKSLDLPKPGLANSTVGKSFVNCTCPIKQAFVMFREFIAPQFKKPRGLFGIFTANLMTKNNRKNYDRLIKDLDLQPNDQILEIGYGPGIGIRMIAETCSTCTIHGLDFSRLMYKRARKYNKEFINAGESRIAVR